MTEALAAARETLAGRKAWLVGGTVRDRLLARAGDTVDLDIVLDGDVREAARRIATATGGAAFSLSDTFGAWRVVDRRARWQVDLTPLLEGSLEQDLAARDLTINAIAEPLEGGPIVDPHGGAADLDAGVLRMVSRQAFASDPLRVLRVARLAAELGFAAEPATAAAAREHAHEVATVSQERVFTELKRLLLSERAVSGLQLMDSLSVTAVVLPEVEALRGVEQNRYHHRDVHGHTMEVLQATIDLERDPEAVLGPQDADAVTALLAEPLADELTRGGALRWGALLHDVAKPRTRIELADGRVGFPDHDRQGAEMARAALERLRTSERLRAHVAALTRNHLRLGFLVHSMPLDRRTTYGYLSAAGDVAADVTLLSVADRLATRGRKADEAIEKHVALARELLGEALAWRRATPHEPLVRGDELARELGLTPGPRLGELLGEIEEARFAGDVRSREEAIAYARRLLRRAPAAGR